MCGRPIPLELCVAAPEGSGVPAGVHRYDPLEHALVRVGPAPRAGAPVIAVTGIPWRTGWRYRERGYRHIYWDAGTALAQLVAAADSAGITARLYTRFPDATVAVLVGADRVHALPAAGVSLGDGAPAIEPAGPAAAGEVDAAPLEFPWSPPRSGPESTMALARRGQAGHPRARQRGPQRPWGGRARARKPASHGPGPAVGWRSSAHLHAGRAARSRVAAPATSVVPAAGQATPAARPVRSSSGMMSQPLSTREIWCWGPPRQAWARTTAGSGPCSCSYSAISSRAAARPAACRAAARAFSVAASASQAETGLPSPAAADLMVSSTSAGTEIESFRAVMRPC